MSKGKAQPFPEAMYRVEKKRNNDTNAMEVK